jgi:hypothetical protein
VVKDEEFKSGKLDTGFITRFNKRQEKLPESTSDWKEQDMAMIAAALRYLREQRRSSTQNLEAVPNRWKISGRKAALNARQDFGEGVSSKWRKQ